MDQQAFTDLLAELDDDTVRQMLIHVAAGSADATALILATITKQQEGAVPLQRGPSSGIVGDDAIESSVGVAGQRLWRSFSSEELVSDQFMAQLESGDVAVATPMAKAAVGRRSDGSFSNVASLAEIGAAAAAPSPAGQGTAVPEAERGRSATKGGSKWWPFGSRRSEGAAKSTKSKRKPSKAVQPP
mmetsp:Transcript_20978/g.54604  ORF Transcript_20978/g.54604 Transcript_20978/m.54604 type:complete len:187 (+) Transcript_20978:258-818(+)|eukprot:CAMPEP_0206322554 /NCGR_PEP_ID=MMETSP0106_2-20121207/19486_1 /ASSEMBLY_ACC=CAM_ASM_000206 /TAXON_ID=81532 /ORGANISM="Acanthoeca-like sp., Strain 10tr" /LENGTH=186 /DNA_ID=CAMNT_0053754731 /DNA_START=179 /DNA_END=739 /DNA_ORIENTATION=+